MTPNRFLQIAELEALGSQMDTKVVDLSVGIPFFDQ